jgi:hypothetical protein
MTRIQSLTTLIARAKETLPMLPPSLRRKTEKAIAHNEAFLHRLISRVARVKAMKAKKAKSPHCLR